MKELTILVDMDDTIEHLLDAWLARVNEKYGRNVKYNDITAWDVSKFYDGLTKEQVYEVIQEDNFWETVKPVSGAAQTLQGFINKGHKVYLVTATPYESVRGKMEKHLFRYFPFLTWDNVIITSHKQLIKGDVLIDDGIHNLEGGDYKKILVDAPYNRDYDAEAHGMIRVHNWDEIEEVINRLASQ